MDAVLNKIDPFPDESILQAYTSLDEDLFIPTGMYLGEGKESVIFDSGCSVSVYPTKRDFGDTLTPVSKTMMGLGAAAQVEGEGTVEWNFKDDYGVKQVIRAHAYYIRIISVRLFSPQSYFVQ